MQKRAWRSVRGQVGVVVLLVTAVVLIFGLSIANRVVKENQIVIDQSDATRVFNVAETGVDDALNQLYQYELTGGNPFGVVTGDQNNQLSIEASEEFNGFLDQGDNLLIDLADNQTGAITINWSKTVCEAGGGDLLITLLNLNTLTSEYESHYYLVGNCAQLNQNFITPNAVASAPYLFGHQLTIDSSNNRNAKLFIQSINNGNDIRVTATANLVNNSQYKILSLASSEAGPSNKAIEVKKSLPTAPSFMNFALFSGGSIVK